MHDVTRQFMELTGVDHAIVAAREQLARYPAMLKRMDAAEAAQQQAIEQAQARLEQARHDGRQAEKEVAALREQVRKYTVQQGNVKTNKEYEAITHEIESLRTRMDQWDTKGLEQLEVEEQAGAQLKGARAELARLTAEHGAERARIETQRTEKLERLEKLESEKKRRFAELPEAWTEEYEVLDARYPGSASAAIDGDHCAGCNWHMVAHVVQHVRAGVEVVQCGHCHRVLYAPEGK